MDRIAPRVLGFATRLLGDASEAEDVTQEAMLRLWKIAPDWEQASAKVSTWVFHVANNLCIDRLRKRKGQPLDAIPELVDPQASVDERLMETDRMNSLNAALDILPDRQKQAVILRHIEGLANPEIAQIMEISVEAVESLTARGKRALAAALADKKEELMQ